MLPSRPRLALSAVLLLLLALAAPPARAAAITVATTADELNRNGKCSLREAIRAANQNTRVDSCPAGGSGTDTITLPAGTYRLTIAGGDDAGALGDLDITGSTTITGAAPAATIVDGNAIHRIFDIRPTATVTLNQLTVRNGFPGNGADGGGILNAGTLTLINSQVSENRTEGTAQGTNGNGGGIWSSGTLTITASRVSDNLTANYSDVSPIGSGKVGGGIYNSGLLHLEQSVVAGNRTDSTDGIAQGGGIYNRGRATLIASTVDQNRAYAQYGAIGGGLYHEGGALSVRQSTISNNVATYAPGMSPRNSYGGGLATDGPYTSPGRTGEVRVTNTTISGNRALRGAGIWHHSDAQLVLKSSTVTRNVATADKGASADPAGGGIANDNAVVTSVILHNTLIAGNTLESGAASDCLGNIFAAGYNLIQATDGCSIRDTIGGNQYGVDPRLGPLHNNGGPTLTHALLAGSPAIDTANPDPPDGSVNSVTCPARDQRDVARPLDGDNNGAARCDIGAYERQVTARGPEVLPADATK